MKTYKLKYFTNGWIVGDFVPSIIRTKDFEFLVRYYKAGDKDAKHVHKVADEITVIISGKFIMNGKKLSAGDVVYLPKGESSVFECIEVGANAVIKTPSVIGDKYLL